MLKKSQAKFILYFIITFIVIFVLLYAIGFVPDSIRVKKEDSLRTVWDKAQKMAIDNQLKQDGIINEDPLRIVIEKIGVDSPVSNPNTTNVATLDEYLLRGAVRYPGSGFPGYGNMFIFAHSTGLRNVNNEAFKAFNGLRNLVVGDMIKIYGSAGLYYYKVSSVRLVDDNQALVEFNNDENILTLSTCNTFGAKSERYVVEADYQFFSSLK